MSDFIYNPPTEPWLDVIYQDDDIIAINKPSGLLTNPGRDPAHYDSAWSRIKQIILTLSWCTDSICRHPA